MSDHSAETGFAPVSLADAMARGTGFRPISFAPSAYAPQPVEESIDEPALDDPFALGLAEGQRLAEAAFVAERHQLLALLAGAEALQDEPSEELAQLIATTVERLVRQIVATAPIDTEWLQAQVDTATAMIADADKARTLRVHPDDAALLADAPLAMAIESDAAMMRGTVRIETSTGWIEHGRAVYIDELRTALGTGHAA
ncbi:flagellar assembly protein FliH [Sphingopyxis sp. YR583]|jgi:flagellar assembly protein FliH|uniref:FliH/SctL family protein n=1 Tax=Sphingopyxis sp. YR583 TaxID=1881047 RepID=UPI0008A74AEB|nr:FliH/SctL family protein [Sphingopyxis sp. YR583]SEH16385.1 flagellar assembly protein FliH [Sphingopyxis sp. YR583]